MLDGDAQKLKILKEREWRSERRLPTWPACRFIEAGEFFMTANINDVERRLSTILAADVVGYSRLVGRDEADGQCDQGAYP